MKSPKSRKVGPGTMNKTQQAILSDMEAFERDYAHVRTTNPEADIFWRSPETLAETRAMRSLCRSGHLVNGVGSLVEQYRLSNDRRAALTAEFPE